MTAFYPKIVELEEGDKDTIHLLIFLFMQFLSKYSRGVSIQQLCMLLILNLQPININGTVWCRRGPANSCLVHIQLKSLTADSE
jgi:hypothetical protein